MRNKLTFSLKILLLVFVFSSACNNDNDCENNCLNGGVCDDGKCNCPERYEGTNCEAQTTPSQIIIHSVKITKFPALNSGNNSWDLQDGPDIFFKVYSTSGIVHHQSTYIQDAEPTQDYTFIPTPEILLISPTQTYEIQVLDNDGISEDDFLGGVTFTPYFSSTNGFPTTLTLDGALVSFELIVRYTW